MPEFHQYQTIKQYARERSRKLDLVWENATDTELIENCFNHLPEPPAGADYATLVDNIGQRSVQEYDWARADKPYYDVYPIMEKLILNTKLDISPLFFSMPYNTMLFRFQKGHEPFGIKTSLVTVGRGLDLSYDELAALDQRCPGLIQQQKNFDGKFLTCYPRFVDGSPLAPALSGLFVPISTTDVDDLGEPRRGPVFEIDGAGRINNLTELQSSGSLPAWFYKNTEYRFPLEHNSYRLQFNTIEEMLACFDDDDIIPDEHEPDMATLPADHIKQLIAFHAKLVALVSLLHNGDAEDIIAPILLKKYEKKYEETDDEARRQWFINKSASICGRGRGFSVGKKLEEKSMTQPHWRSAHWALYWTGVGRKVPKLILRSIARVVPKALTQVPTGFMQDQPAEEEVEKSSLEYVYLCRDKTQNLVKIGRTKKKVTERIAASSTWVPGGLELIGYLATGDSVALETRLHRQYAEKRRTNEFFELSDADIKAILSGALA